MALKDEIQAAQDRLAKAVSARNAERILAAEGRYLVVWRKVGGEWRMHRDMFNTQ
jgi:ketosteroid isomerase-like protein